MRRENNDAANFCQLLERNLQYANVGSIVCIWANDNERKLSS